MWIAGLPTIYSFIVFSYVHLILVGYNTGSGLYAMFYLSIKPFYPICFVNSLLI
jgi:hypothetical protein